MVEPYCTRHHVQPSGPHCGPLNTVNTPPPGTCPTTELFEPGALRSRLGSPGVTRATMPGASRGTGLLKQPNGTSQ